MIEKQFSWSVTRHDVFAFCKQAYINKYHLSWGGWDKSSPDLSQKTYFLKNLKNSRQWLSDIFRKSARKYLTESKIRKKRAVSEIFHIGLPEFNRAWDEAVSALSSQTTDTKKTSIIELYYKEIPPADVREFGNQMMRKFKESLASFAESSICGEIEKSSYLKFRELAHPESFLLNGIKIFLDPDFLLDREGKMEIIDIFLGTPAENPKWEMKASVSAIFAKQKFPARQIIPKAFFFTPAELQNDKFTDPCETLKIIISSANAMLDFEKNQINIYEKDPNKIKCSSCEFRNICAQNI
jgi:hypothetical protein